MITKVTVNLKQENSNQIIKNKVLRAMRAAQCTKEEIDEFSKGKDAFDSATHSVRVIWEGEPMWKTN